MENRILENLQHFLMTKVKEHIMALLERMLEKQKEVRLNELTAVATRVVPVIADDRT